MLSASSISEVDCGCEDELGISDFGDSTFRLYFMQPSISCQKKQTHLFFFSSFRLYTKSWNRMWIQKAGCRSGYMGGQKMLLRIWKVTAWNSLRTGDFKRGSSPLFSCEERSRFQLLEDYDEGRGGKEVAAPGYRISDSYDRRGLRIQRQVQLSSSVWTYYRLFSEAVARFRR